ncbi:MAG: phosphatidylserine decarboxylase [Phycisphaerales bacterium]|nr:phosphatidylserine decarboxylase [Phycisphaerales bacterium]MCB9856813.1 phosphatidylserine decarboxylase [Phycisphaerales bacterium]MCB9862060.1 phosphatidylserine decarboxylase [Phycisphaerales bacterium]
MITRDGFKEVAITTLTFGAGGITCAWAAVTISPWWWIGAVPLLATWGFVLSFFRDPPRSIPSDPGLMVSPADGKITEVARLDGWPGIDEPVLKVSIFLSVFNVHVNRAPCNGRVVATQYERGEFLDVRHPESGMRNERNSITIDPDADYGPIIVRQIAGLIARRIVCHIDVGDRVTRGDRFGMIKFGSRTDLIVPASSGLEPAVKLGDVVKGGATILMRPGQATR